MQAEITLRQAAQQALEALEAETSESWECNSYHPKIQPAMTALKQALAEPEQPHDLLCVCGAEWDIYSDGREELVAAPTPRKPLTDGEHEDLMRGRSTLDYGRAVERAHGIGEQT